MAQQHQSTEFDVSDLSSIPRLGKGKNEILDAILVPRKGLFDMVAQEPET